METGGAENDVRDVIARAPELGDSAELTIAPLRDVQSLNNSLWTASSSAAKWVIRLANPAVGQHLGVNRDEEFAAATGAADAGVGPPILYFDRDTGHMVTPWIETGPEWKPAEFRDPANMTRLVDLLHRLHAVTELPGDPAAVFRRIEFLLDQASTLDAELPESLDDHRTRLREIEADHRSSGPGLNHNDLWANNLLDDGTRLWLVDWEFAGRGDGLYDLATISMAGQYDTEDDRRLLAEYGAGDLAGLESMKWVVRLFEAAWSAIMARLTESADFNYAAHARHMFEAL